MHAINLKTTYSAFPLRFASPAGLAFTCFWGGVLAFVISRYMIDGYSVPNFPILASIIAIFLGVQLFALGIIGEYVDRVFSRTMDHPAYTIRQKTSRE